MNVKEGEPMIRQESITYRSHPTLNKGIYSESVGKPYNYRDLFDPLDEGSQEGPVKVPNDWHSEDHIP
jgi:hypothetical protein